MAGLHHGDGWGRLGRHGSFHGNRTSLKPKIILRYGLPTLRERPPIDEAAALAEEMRVQVTRSIKEMQTKR
jgi:hypothetical protein